MLTRLRHFAIVAFGAIACFTAGAAAAQVTPFSTSPIPSVTDLHYDQTGFFYVGTDEYNAPLRRISSTGVVSTIGLPLGRVEHVIRGPGGDLFIVDQSSGQILRSADDGLTTSVYATGLSGPYGAAFGPDGALYVTNTTSGTVVSIAPGGNVAPVTIVQLNSPRDVVYLPSGDLLVAEFGPSPLARIDLSTGTSTPVGTLTDVFSIALNATGEIFVSELNSGTVSRITLAGGRTVVVTGLTSPTGLAFGPGGQMFVAEYGPGRVSRIGPPPAAVPTMSEWAMILFGAILAGGAALYIQRRRLTA